MMSIVDGGRRPSAGRGDSPDIMTSSIIELSDIEWTALRSYQAEYTRSTGSPQADLLVTPEDWTAARLGGVAFEFHMELFSDMIAGEPPPEIKALLQRKAERLIEARDVASVLDSGEQEVNAMGVIRRFESEVVRSFCPTVQECAPTSKKQSAPPASMWMNDGEKDGREQSAECRLGQLSP